MEAQSKTAELLALDFDGVISDSAPEAYLVALRTYAELRRGAFIDRLLQRTEVLTPDEIRVDPTYLRFVAMMPLGNRAEDYAVELTLLAKNREARDQAEFRAAFDAEPEGFLPAFHQRFYETRSLLREEDLGRWSALLAPYPELIPLLHRRAADRLLAIATAKDRATVEILLPIYGIDDLFSREHLLDKEAGRSKRAHLQELHERTGVAFSKIVFVDDKVNHLDDVASLGVQCVLAGWGYNGEREARTAREHGHRVCSLADFESC